MIGQIYAQLNYNNFSMLIGIAGLILAVFTYFKTREFRQAVYRQKSENIIGGVNPELESRIEIRCDNLVISRVTKTTVWLWNNGNQTIRRADISEADPLRITFPENTQIIEAKIAGMSLAANAVGVKAIKGNQVFPSFDFLDSTQGFACEILHNGQPDKCTIRGTIIGAGSPVLWNPNSAKNLMSHVAAVAPLNLTIWITTIACVVSLVEWLGPDREWAKAIAFLSSLCLSAVATELLGDRLSKYFSKRDLPANLPPK